MSKFKNGIHPGVYTQMFGRGSPTTTFTRRNSAGKGPPDRFLADCPTECIADSLQPVNFEKYFNETLVLPLALLL